MLYKESEEDYAKEVLEMASIEREERIFFYFIKSVYHLLSWTLKLNTKSIWWRLLRKKTFWKAWTRRHWFQIRSCTSKKRTLLSTRIALRGKSILLYPGQNSNRYFRMTNKITSFNDSWLDTMAKVNQMREDLKRLSAKQSENKEITSAILDKNL